MYLLPLKVPHREIEFWIVFMFLYLFIHSFTYSYFFTIIYLFSLYLFTLTKYDISVLNRSIIAQHVFTSTQSASPQDWVLNCIYVYLFIHSFTYAYFFFTIIYLFSLNLIYINQVWLSVWNRSKIHAHLLPLKVRPPQLRTLNWFI